jgi:hypothetical protein
MVNHRSSESQAVVIPTATKNAPAPYFEVISIGQHANKIALTEDRWLTINADPAGCGPFDCKADPRWQRVSQILRLAAKEGDLAKIVVAVRHKWPQSRIFLHEFGKNPTFNDSCCRAAEIDQSVMERFPLSNEHPSERSVDSERRYIRRERVQWIGEEA